MTQAILLDTCAAIFMVDETLKAQAVEALSESYRKGHNAMVSPITAWEIGVLSSKGRLRSPYQSHAWFERLMGLAGVEIAPISAKTLIESSFLPGKLNNDPADRIIAATAREHGFTVMTRDRALLDYGREGYLSVVEC